MVRILFLNRLFVNEMLILKSSYLQGFLSLWEICFLWLGNAAKPFSKTTFSSTDFRYVHPAHIMAPETEQLYRESQV